MKLQCSLATLLMHLLPCAFFAGCTGSKNSIVYSRDDVRGFLSINRLPADGRVGFGPITVNTQQGTKQLREVQGDCEFVAKQLFPRESGMARVVVETKNPNYYEVVYDRADSSVDFPNEALDKLGLEVVHERRRHLTCVIRANSEETTGLQRFDGQPRWPELRVPEQVGLLQIPYEIRKFSNGSVYHGKGDNEHLLCFDGVSIGELAKFLEEESIIPVIDQTGDPSFYSFTLPERFYKLCGDQTTTSMPGLGLSISNCDTEIDMIVVRDQHAANETTGSHPLPEISPPH
jgi:hypothetical protein